MPTTRQAQAYQGQADKQQSNSNSELDKLYDKWAKIDKKIIDIKNLYPNPKHSYRVHKLNKYNAERKEVERQISSFKVSISSDGEVKTTKKKQGPSAGKYGGPKSKSKKWGSRAPRRDSTQVDTVYETKQSTPPSKKYYDSQKDVMPKTGYTTSKYAGGMGKRRGATDAIRKKQDDYLHRRSVKRQMGKGKKKKK